MAASHAVCLRSSAAKTARTPFANTTESSPQSVKSQTAASVRTAKTRRSTAADAQEFAAAYAFCSLWGLLLRLACHCPEHAHLHFYPQWSASQRARHQSSQVTQPPPRLWASLSKEKYECSHFTTIAPTDFHFRHLTN